MSDHETVLLSVKIDAKDKEQIATVATAEGKDVSVFVRDVLSAYMESKSVPFVGEVKQRGAPGKSRRPGAGRKPRKQTA